ncbi:ABC-type transport auxiliary lipoprotein family protein [Xylophilus sp. GOD-11R]|uniref:ABC-type transport auxiliary lipoprotein family protein n=1 Tax=Xylophilus sp. GOD-11R TaxID=3089814 RepID=UPI00298CD834|nr:ABC-type transport auxiliary lipoprotein family protein [Xylophilus sp. GOD-11R]WPB56804.1 ABC-type transport auxiliary lipoprotein family protein [Xylophilus sp. GOD-11R]
MKTRLFDRRFSTAAIAGVIATLALGACSVLPDKPARPVSYDFGTGIAPPSVTEVAISLPPIALADVDAAALADTAAITYRLQYTDAQQLRPYAQARWALPPAQLVRLRVREALGQRRPILDADDVLAQRRVEGGLPRILRLQLEEFSQVFESPSRSEGVLRLRATLVDNTVQGENFVGQRVFVVRRPATTPDAPGGVQALAAATDAAAAEIEAWLARLAPQAASAPMRPPRP